jgi:hypothetical protein
MSLAESCTNSLGGFAIAVGVQALVFPLFGIYTSWTQDIMIVTIFMIVGIVRQYVFRRFFVWLERRAEGRVLAPTPEGLYETIVEAGCLRSARWYDVPPDGTGERTS